MPALANAKHEAVLQAYLKLPERVGWRAYQSVYKKSSQRAAETAWSRLLKDAAFKARHDALTAEVTERAIAGAVMDLTEVLEELSKLGRSSIKKVVRVGGDDAGEVISSLEDLPDDVAAAIQELTTEIYTEGAGKEAREVKRVKLRLHSKPAALAELRRHLEPTRLEHSGKDGGPIETKEVDKPSPLELARRIAFALEQGARAAAQQPKPAASAAPKRKGKAA